jgi:hypothetical protein
LSSDQNQLAKGVTTRSSDFYVAHLIKSNTPGPAADSSGVLSQDIVETDHMHNILTES